MIDVILPKFKSVKIESHGIVFLVEILKMFDSFIF